MKDVNNKELNDPLELVKKFKPLPAKKSKEQVWAELELLMAKPIKEEALIKSFNIRKWSIAASIALFVSFSGLAFLKLYTKNVDCLTGEQRIAYLPDGSTVHLNSKSSVSFHPLWWKMSREVKLEGEGFFQVKKGEKFTVVSEKGTTSVMGTSFNIFARDEDYEVTCLTGKVKVLSLDSKDEVIIIPNQMVTLDKAGKLNTNLNVNAELAVDWTKGKFIFTQTPLHKVLSEIARRYGVEIKNTETLNQLYTGNFTKQKEIEAILDLVCKPFDIEYKKLPTGAFVIL